MKKNLLFSAMLLLALSGAVTAKAQHLDTVDGRQRNYYYSDWYDTTLWYLHPDSFPYYMEYDGGDFMFMSWGTEQAQRPNAKRYYAFENYTPKPLKIKGVAIMVSHIITNPTNPDGYHSVQDHVWDSSKAPEAVYLYRYDSTETDTNVGPLKLVDSARWDTLTPKWYRLQSTADGRWPSSTRYCYVYEVMFDTTHILQDAFYIGGSCRSNVHYYDAEPGWKPGWHHFPTYYLTVANYNQASTRPRENIKVHVKKDMASSPEGPWHFFPSDTNQWLISYCTPGYGPMAAIIDTMMIVDASSSDTAMGMVSGSGSFPESSFHTITATPKRGFRFLQWNDGITDNPRTFCLTWDTAFTAIFGDDQLLVVSTTANDPAMGYVTGCGYNFYSGDTATLTAIPTNPALYAFSHWNDGITDNPRRIEVLSDTSFIAYFESLCDTIYSSITSVEAKSLFTLTPNPTTGEVTLQVNSEKLKDKSCTVTVLDAAGHEVLRTTLNSQPSTLNLNLSSLPAGTYFVTLQTPTTTATKKLIIK